MYNRLLTFYVTAEHKIGDFISDADRALGNHFEAHWASIGAISIGVLLTGLSDTMGNNFTPEQNAQIACFCGTANKQTWGEDGSECDYQARVLDKAMWTNTLRMCRYDGRPSVCIFHGADAADDGAIVNSIEVRTYPYGDSKGGNYIVPIGDSHVKVTEPGCTITPSW